ncbi:hypothetical protein AB6F11_00120 [Vibrio sp. 10N.247.311.14]|jgi:hypothetical protein|uniref:hypothetical protein n=1 Tax=Vibrio TaxID=662 RepID=UPI000A3666BC|nr:MULTISPECIES: hypothetical protein [Vibrio]TKF69987.1 hypothetical protein FCV58_01430 [Vibrio sp. F13]
MSKIIAALEGKASVEIGRLITEAIDLEIGTNLISPTGEFMSDDVKLAIAHLKSSIDSRVDALNTLYTFIEDSQHPEKFFDAESIKELTDAAAMIQSFKDILKTQFYGIVRCAGVESEAVQSFKLVCRANAKFSTSVRNLISLHKQLCIPKRSEHRPELAFSSEMADMLKKATDSVVAKALVEE